MSFQNASSRIGPKWRSLPLWFQLFLLVWITDWPTDTVTVVVQAILPPTKPPWPPTYDMKASLITMQVNSSGLSSPTRGADFGIPSYDWSNMKEIWAATKPMNCEELLREQARQTKQAAATQNNANTHVFVYRNIVKALPWFATVREKLNDPAYAEWFIRFDDSKQHNQYHVPRCAAENATLCSVFYHDQLQTPQVPTAAQPHPDGVCVDYCDCGGIHPCGEYVFDHRNGTMLRTWLVEQVILAALDDGVVDGLFLDDYWCSDLICQETNNATDGCPCNDPGQGPTEIVATFPVDTGLSDEDIRDVTLGWNETMTAVQQALLDSQAYTWSLLYGQSNANAWPEFLRKETCLKDLRAACQVDSVWQQHAMLFGFTVSNATILTQLKEDLAYFLLVRGPYAYAGWGVWGMTWPFNAEPGHGGLPPLPHGVPLPKLFDLDFGVPLGVCSEARPGVFVREWTHASIELDCAAFDVKILTMSADKNDGALRNVLPTTVRVDS